MIGVLTPPGPQMEQEMNQQPGQFHGNVGFGVFQLDLRDFGN
jgi:hypothetical protein